MAVGSWNPESNSSNINIPVDVALVQRLLAIAESGKLDNLDRAMTAEDQQQNAIMQADASEWEKVLKNYSEEQLISLVRFFTVVEVQLSHWVGANKSPVIRINNILKKRGSKLSKEMLIWIRENSNNRFIPNGAVL